MFSDQNLYRLAPETQIHLPAGVGFKSLGEALLATTHLLIVAHADDDLIVGAQAISETYGASDQYMTAIILSASPGSGRPPGYEARSDAQMKTIRWDEQKSAANAGRYAATVQLGFSSSDIQGKNGQESVKTIVQILKLIQDHAPQLAKLYLHSVFDEHDTHVAASSLALEGARESRVKPQECWGVEVSSSLAWLPPASRALLPVTRMPLVRSLLGRYKTEIAKRRYDRGLEGRAMANAVFQRDTGKSSKWPQLCALDYNAIINTLDRSPTPELLADMIEPILRDHRDRKLYALQRVSPLLKSIMG